MEVEFNELELRYVGLRLVQPGRQARLEVSLAREGQHNPVLVVADGVRFVLVDGYQRVTALKRLKRDVVEVALLPFDEAAALVQVWRMEASRRRTAIEDGWLLAELVERHGWSRQQLASAFQRSKSWVSRRLSLVHALPESAQQAVRRGIIPAHSAMKVLVPLARANAGQCERLVSSLGSTVVSVRDLERLYATWRSSDDSVRGRIVENPLLFLKADKAVSAKAPVDAGQALVGTLESVSGLCGKAKRWLRDGVFARANPESRQTLWRSWREVELAVEGLREVMNQEVDRAGAEHSNCDSTAA